MQKSHSRQRLHDRGICVVIPTYNNVGTIRDVVMRTLEECSDVIVVNDGSTDGTELILREIEGITLVDYERNAGKGTALKRGFKKALEMGFAYAITLDGDGQHYPEDIPLLLEANIKNPGCLLIGQRNLEGVERSKGSKFANSFSNFWFCVQTFHYIPDTQTGYRLYPLLKLHGLNLLTSRYEAELELLVFASWNGVKIVPVKVNVYYPPAAERVSHFRPGPDFARISLLNTCLCVLALIYGLPAAILRGLFTLFFTLFSLFVYLTGALMILMPFALVYVPICKLRGRKTPMLHKMLHWYGSLVCRLLGIFGSKVTIENPDGTDLKKPSIVICNHQSHLDLMVLLSMTEKIVFLTNDWVWKSPFFGYFIRNAEYHPVSRGLDNLVPQLRDLMNRGYNVCIFPEGTRSKDSRIGRFHKGAFHLARKLGADITPTILYGAGRVLRKKGHFMHRWPIVLEILGKITPQELSTMGDNDLEISKKIRRTYISEYNALCDRIDQNV